MTDMDGLLQIERFGERCEIVGVCVHLIAVPRLTRPAVTAAIVSDTAVSARGQKNHLVFPCVRAQRPAVAENHGLSLSPVLLINVRSVFRRDHAHELFSCRCVIPVVAPKQGATSTLERLADFRRISAMPARVAQRTLALAASFRGRRGMISC